MMFISLQVRYGLTMPFILRGLTCTFPGGKKTGIVGRTGSGKSTLIQTIFRIIDPAVGHIFIDGTDISTIGLHDLRSRLGIIPQEPIMFQGTLRNNLDPLDEYTDEEIWEVLHLANPSSDSVSFLHSKSTYYPEYAPFFSSCFRHWIAVNLEKR